MRRLLLPLALLSTIGIPGCRNTPDSTASPSPATTVNTLAEMKAQWGKMRKQYAKDCLSGTPDHINSTQALCERERQDMAPLGNSITAAELTAAKQTNP